MLAADNICNQVEKNPKFVRSMSPQIALTSSFFFDDFDEYSRSSDNEFRSYVYTRGNNPTTEVLEKKLALLEGGQRCKVFASGMGAISATLLSVLSEGDHVILINTVYGTTCAFVKSLAKYGVTCSVVNSTSTKEIISAIRDNTSVIYFESPSSEKFEMVDLDGIAAAAKSRNIMTMIDNTWSTPLFQNPLAHGIDVVVHSCSKYIGGHSDIVCGAVITSEKLMAQIEENGYLYLGAASSPVNSYLALRGLRTLPVRLHALDATVRKVLDYVCTDSRIGRVYHPYCATGNQKELSDKYLSGFGSLFAIDLADEDLDKLKVFVNALRVFTLGVSWGGFESLVLPMFKGHNQDAILQRGLPLTHVRMYAGLEDADSLIQDIRQALDSAYGKLD